MAENALRSLVVADKVIEAHNMVSFELVDPEGGELPDFSPGSHVNVTLPGGIVRQYSLYNGRSGRRSYRIGVWKDPNGRGGSRALHEKVNIGDALPVSSPRNLFRVPRNVKRAVLFARGIGVTPLLSIADYLKSQSIPFALHYVFALMSPDSFRGTIDGANFAEDTKYYLEDSRHNQVLNAAAVLAAQDEDTHLFICGADWWLDPIVKMATDKGWSEDRIHVERFTAKLAAAALDKVFEVKIASTGVVFKIPGDKTIAGFLEEKGLKIPTSCEQGMCGTCKVKVLEGEADHRDKRLSAQERSEGFMLACVSRAKGDRLVLDL